MIRLLVKTYDTELKYLCKTTREDYLTYRGSGRLIPQSAELIDTDVLFESEDKKVFKDIALYYSETWTVDTNPLFYNMCYEQGQGGYTSYTFERSQKISQALKGIPKTEDHKAKMRAVKKGRHIGASNPAAKSWSIISPTGDVIKCKGDLESKCISLDISVASLRNHKGHKVPAAKLTDRGTIMYQTRLTETQIKRRIRTTGYCLKED